MGRLLAVLYYNTTQALVWQDSLTAPLDAFQGALFGPSVDCNARPPEQIAYNSSDYEINCRWLMKSLADGLPPELANQIHDEWRKNEADYWAVRDQILVQYEGQWIGFADGAFVASGDSPVAVFHAAEATGRNPFVTCVGREDEPTRMRSVGVDES